MVMDEMTGRTWGGLQRGQYGVHLETERRGSRQHYSQFPLANSTPALFSAQSFLLGIPSVHPCLLSVQTLPTLPLYLPQDSFGF